MDFKTRDTTTARTGLAQALVDAYKEDISDCNFDRQPGDRTRYSQRDREKGRRVGCLATSGVEEEDALRRHWTCCAL